MAYFDIGHDLDLPRSIGQSDVDRAKLIEFVIEDEPVHSPYRRRALERPENRQRSYTRITYAGQRPPLDRRS
jgi:hypothetical protein